MEIICHRCEVFAVFDKTDAQQWNEYHMQYCYGTMWFVAMVINDWHLNNSLWLVIDPTQLEPL